MWSTSFDTGYNFFFTGTTLISVIPLPRLLYAMSQDGMVLKCFSRVNKRTNVPVIGTLISGLFIGKYSENNYCL